MNNIFDNQLSILIDILPLYLTPKQCTKLYTSNLILYYIYIDNNKFESNYFIPKNRNELKIAVNEWYNNKEKAILKYGNISYWNTINITDMNSLFYTNYKFNDNISDWNTSNVINMENMFYNVREFNQPINNWNTENVVNMNQTFYNARIFNQELNNWNINKVENMMYMFYNAIDFDKTNCNKWNLNHISDKYKYYMYNRN